MPKNSELYKVWNAMVEYRYSYNKKNDLLYQKFRKQLIEIIKNDPTLLNDLRAHKITNFHLHHTLISTYKRMVQYLPAAQLITLMQIALTSKPSITLFRQIIKQYTKITGDTTMKLDIQTYLPTKSVNILVEDAEISNKIKVNFMNLDSLSKTLDKLTCYNSFKLIRDTFVFKSNIDRYINIEANTDIRNFNSYRIDSWIKQCGKNNIATQILTDFQKQLGTAFIRDCKMTRTMADGIDVSTSLLYGYPETVKSWLIEYRKRFSVKSRYGTSLKNLATKPSKKIYYAEHFIHAPRLIRYNLRQLDILIAAQTHPDEKIREKCQKVINDIIMDGNRIYQMRYKKDIESDSKWASTFINNIIPKIDPKVP